jgi:hypothetical protein
MSRRGPGDMKIVLKLDGLTTVARGFAQLRDAGERSARTLRAGAQAVTRDIQRVATVAKTAAKGVSLVGGAALAVGAGGVAILNKSLRDTASLSREVAEEIDELQKTANSFGIEDGRTLGGLRFAAANEGASAGAVDKALAALQLLAEDALNGEERALELFSLVGARYGDIVDELGNVRSGDQLFLAIAERFSELSPEVNRSALAMQLFGKRAGPELVTLLNSGRGAIESYIGDFNELRAIGDGDVALVGAFKAQQDRRLAAFDGLRTAVARNFLPALQQVDQQLELFFVEQRGAAATFGAVAGGFVVEFVPKLLEAGRVLAALLTGRAAELEDTPLKRGLEAALGLVRGFTSGIMDVLDLLSTGDLNAAPEWLQSTVRFGRDGVEAISGLLVSVRELSDFWSGTLKPAFDSLVESVKSVYALLGVNEPATQLAITAALVVFSGTITTLIGKLALLAAGLVKAGAAAAGLGAAGAGAAGVAGAAVATGAAVVGGATALGVAAVSSRNFQQQLDEATRVARELAESEGEAYAAAYMKTFLETVPQEFKGFSLANRALNFLTGGRAVDIDGAIVELQLLIDAGGVEEGQAGVRRALADLGLTRAEDGTISGAAGYDLAARLQIREVELTGDAQRKLDELTGGMGAKLSVPAPAFATGGMVRGPGTGTSDSILARLSNGEFVMRAAAVRRYGLGLLEGLNNLRLPGFALGGLVSPSAVPAPAMLLGNGGTPVHLTLPGLGEYQLSARQDVAEDLLRAARKAKRSRL